MKKQTTLIIVIVLIVLCCGIGCSQYNGMVTAETDVDKAWSDVQTQYQRRFDLIPNLVETVKGYAAHESETFENVTMARAGLAKAYNSADSLVSLVNPANQQSMNEFSQSQADLNRAFSVYVNAVHEAYPQLVAGEQFLNLQNQLEGTENRIAVSRNKYIEKVRDYNLKIRRFPASIFASLFGFTPKAQFEAESDAQTAPKVKF